MSKIISIWKKSPLEKETAEDIHTICKHIAPNNIAPVKPLISVKENWAYGIMNPVPSSKICEFGVYLGASFDQVNNWFEIGQNDLDGSFAIFRNSEQYAEICSDMGGTRSIWYYIDEEYFIAATSQRAIIMFLRSFHFDERVIPWMLSSGTLGPYISWDKRIKLLPPDASVLLDKNTWTLNLTHHPVTYNEISKTDAQHEKDLRLAIDETFENIKLDLNKWAVTLSGGKDSRGVLLLILNKTKNGKSIRTYTYGHKDYDAIKNSDGYIAKRLASKYGVQNEYFSAFSISEQEPIEGIFERILKTGEGRVDNFTGYMDGLAFWKYLYEKGTEGIFRGDINFGLAHDLIFKSAKESHYFGQVFLCEEWANLKVLKKYPLPKQEFPPEMINNPNESYNDFQDRFYSSFRMPLFLAALSDFKLSYLEVINPLLSRKILSAIRSTPDRLRLNTRLWSAYLKTMENEIPFAVNTSHDMHLNEMNKSTYKEHQLKKIKESAYIPDYLKNMAFSENKKENFYKGIFLKFFRKSKIKNILSTKQRFLIWRSLIINKKDPTLSKEKIINRVFILAEMQRILHEDALTLLKVKKEIY
jgi:hypothetical protein